MSEKEVFDEDEISLFDLVNPLIVQWKMWVACAVFGLVVGAAWWLSKGFEAELAARPVRKLEFVQWRSISNGLPILAENLGQIPGISPEKKALFELASSSTWWQKNVTPDYSVSKNDIKNLGLDEKQLEAGIINRIVIKAPGGSKADAMQMAYAVEDFIRDGGAYLAIKSILSRYEVDAIDVDKKLRARISKDEVELAYLNKRADAIETLRKRYPDNEKSASQAFLDPKDNAAKYLPLGTQLMAVKTEINAIEESLSRSRDILEQQRVIQSFLSKALPLLKVETSGFDLLVKLGKIEGEIRRSTDAGNKQQVLALDLIAEQMAGVKAGYSQLFEGNSSGFARRAPKIPMVLGALAGLLIGVLWIFVASAFRRGRQSGELKSR